LEPTFLINQFLEIIGPDSEFVRHQETDPIQLINANFCRLIDVFEWRVCIKKQKNWITIFKKPVSKQLVGNFTRSCGL
jgi:hypothetical protein